MFFVTPKGCPNHGLKLKLGKNYHSNNSIWPAVRVEHDKNALQNQNIANEGTPNRVDEFIPELSGWGHDSHIKHFLSDNLCTLIRGEETVLVRKEDAEPLLSICAKKAWMKMEHSLLCLP